MGHYYWVDNAWQRLNSYALSHGIQFFSVDEGYRATLERRMPVNDITGEPLPDGIASMLHTYSQQIVKEWPNVKLPPAHAVESIRAFMAGYHMIAVSEASEDVVNDVYNLLKYPFFTFYDAYKEGREMGEFEHRMGTDQWYKDLHTARSMFVNGNRADKVIAIDAVAHLLHEYEPRPLVEDLFVSGLESVTFTPIGIALSQVFDIWFGVDPRRGVTFAEYFGR